MTLTDRLEDYKRYVESMKFNSEAFLKKLNFFIECSNRTATDFIPENEKECIKALFRDVDRFYGRGNYDNYKNRI